ncbi:jmjC domain-containing protein 8 isoform X1 [Ambystoma mexicanum]|uniref:jmjC domain-containing protein 8 isoform X1 n=1 Tax=Ambystoma mexicanum TaxID=8296 RepID=UPI0037E87DF4
MRRGLRRPMTPWTPLLLLILLPSAIRGHSDCLEEDGGWFTNRYTAPQEEEYCSVERRDASLTYAEFIEQYAFSRPVILRGITSNLAFQALCTKKMLLQEFGDRIVRLSTANTYSYEKVDVPFQEYVEHLLKPQDEDTLGCDPEFAECLCVACWSPFGRVWVHVRGCGKRLYSSSGTGIWLKTDIPHTSFSLEDASVAAYRIAFRKQREQRNKLLPLPSSGISTSFSHHGYSALVRQPENMWVYLARCVFKMLHFCLTDVHSSADLISTCLVAIPTPTPVLKELFGVLHNDSLVQQSDVRNYFSVYEYCTFCSDMFTNGRI